MSTTTLIELASGFSLQRSAVPKSAVAGSLFTVTTGNKIDDISTTPGLPIQNDVSSVAGSVDFIDSTEAVFTDLTNPSAVVGLSTAAPEIIASIDYIPLFKDLTIDPIASIEEVSDSCNEGIYNTIYQNVLLDSLTREGARNTLIKILKNENGEVDAAIGRLSNLSVDSHSDLLDAFSRVAAYSAIVRKDLSESPGNDMRSARNILYEIFQSIRQAMSSPTSLQINISSPKVESYLSSIGLNDSFLNFHGFDPRRIDSIDSMYSLATGELSFSEDEFKNSSNSKVVGQIIQDIRKCVLYGSSIRDLEEDRDSSLSGFSPYTVFNDGPDGKFASVVLGLNSLNSDSSVLPLAQISTLSSEDYGLFLESLDDLSFSERSVIISQIISRDISLSFLKRTDLVLNLAGEVIGEQNDFGSNPTISSLIDQTVGNIGGSLFDSSPGTESMASLINPKTEVAGSSEKIFSFEKFSIDSSFGNAISGFGAFAGDLISEINTHILSIESDALSEPYEFNWVDFCEDFSQKSTAIGKLIPILIGGAGSSNNVFRAVTESLSSYLESNGFIHDNDTIQGAISGDLYAFLNETGENYDLSSPADGFEFLRLAIFILAGSDSEVGQLLVRFLDLRRLMKRMEDIPDSSATMEFSTSPGETTSSVDEFINTIQSSYQEYYAIAQELASKIFESTQDTSLKAVGGYGSKSSIFSDSSSITREYMLKRVVTVQSSGVPSNLSGIFNDPDGDVEIMKTPIGLALLTSPDENCIFDLPQIALDQLYEDFVEKDVPGVGITTNDILRINRAVSRSVTVTGGGDEEDTTLADIADEVSESGIVTDFRGYSDNLRRRAMAYMIIDILQTLDIVKSSNQKPIEVEITSDVTSLQTIRTNRGASGTNPLGSVIAPNGNVDITVEVKFNLDMARSSQLCLAMNKYVGRGIYQAEGMDGYDGAISRLDTAISSVFSDQYDSSIEETIRDIHGYLIKEYSRCETLTEALTVIGSELSRSATGINESFSTEQLSTLNAFFKYASLSAQNAIENGEISSLSETDALSAIFSTCMFSEMMGNASLDRYGVQVVADAGFFDSEISGDGTQSSSIDLLIPATEVAPANILSKRILPSLRFLTAPGRKQDTSDSVDSGASKQDPILAIGDPEEDRMKILSIGLPVGLSTRLREEATNYSEWHGEDSSGFDTGENYENSTLINIKVYKKDLDRGDVVYKPKSFIFDTQVRPSTRTFYGGGGAKITSNIPESADIISSIDLRAGPNGIPVSLAAFGNLVEDDMNAIQSSYAETLPGVGFTGTSGVDTSDTFSLNQISDLYDDLLFYKYGYDATITDTLNDIFTDAADEIKKNHVQDYVLKEYLKAVAGIDVREIAFPLFQTGCNYSSNSDGAGLGTGTNDFNFLYDREIFGYFSNAEEDPLYVSETYLQSARSDILSIVADVIDNNISDLETSISSNVAAKLRQSFIMSPEKYYNRSQLPGLFERTFCVLIDPDGFDIDIDQSAPEFESDQLVAEYVSELFSFFVTVEILKHEDDLYTR